MNDSSHSPELLFQDILHASFIYAVTPRPRPFDRGWCIERPGKKANAIILSSRLVFPGSQGLRQERRAPQVESKNEMRVQCPNVHLLTPLPHRMNECIGRPSDDRQTSHGWNRIQRSGNGGRAMQVKQPAWLRRFSQIMAIAVYKTLLAFHWLHHKRCHLSSNTGHVLCRGPYSACECDLTALSSYI